MCLKHGSLSLLNWDFTEKFKNTVHFTLNQKIRWKIGNENLINLLCGSHSLSAQLNSQIVMRQKEEEGVLVIFATLSYLKIIIKAG